MDTPLMSIIYIVEDVDIPVTESLRSCINQSYRNKEIVVVDRSAHGTVQSVIAEIGNETVRYFHLPSIGHAAALNHGLSNAGGDYVVFVLAGQEVHEQWLEKAIEWLDRSKADAVRCATMYVQDQKISVVDTPSESRSWYQRLLREPLFESHAVIVKREACARFPEHVDSLAEWEFWIESLRTRKLFVWPEYIGSIVHGEKPALLLPNDMSQVIRRLHLLLGHRHEVKGLLHTWKHRVLVRKLYAQYLQAVQQGTVEQDPQLERQIKST